MYSSGRKNFVELPSEMLSSSSVDNAMSKVFESVLYTRTQLENGMFKGEHNIEAND